MMMTRSMLVCAAALAVASEVAIAQPSRGFQRPAPSTSSTRRGVAVAAPPAANPTPAVTPFGAPAPRPVALKLVPAVIMSDGSVFADFGFGMEPVRRACGGVGGLGDARSMSSGITPTSMLPGFQPAPAQRTASQQNLTSQIQPHSPQRVPSQVAVGSCFTRDASGRVFVTR